MALSELDRDLLQRCLQRQPGAWESLVDRFIGLVIHVINHSAAAKSIRLSADDRDDLCSDVFLRIVHDDFAVLRRFRGQSSLATYLTVVARRVVVRRLLASKMPARLSDAIPAENLAGDEEPVQRVDDREEIERMLERLDQQEAEVVRMYHLEGRSYQEISSAVGMPENTVGPLLSRARHKLRQAQADPARS